MVGYADVIDSGVDGIEAGQRYYGYWPSAQLSESPAGQDHPPQFSAMMPAIGKTCRKSTTGTQRTDDDPLSRTRNPNRCT